MPSSSSAAGGRPRSRFARWRLTAVLAGTAALAALVPASTAAAASWPSYSQSIAGNRNQPAETTINTSNVGQLVTKWTFTLSGSPSTDGVSATPTVADGVVYFPAWDGYLYAVNASGPTGGTLLWKHLISDYSSTGAVSRNAPLVLGNELVLGDNAPGPQANGANVFAVDRTTGALLWKTQVDSNPAAIITSSSVNYGNEIVVGVASNEEADAINPAYHCCTFRGAVVALDATTGKMLWKTYTIPSNTKAGGDSNAPCAGSTEPNGPFGCGYTGGAVWATPTILPSANEVFVGTGNNYTAPDAAVSCANTALDATPPQDDSGCTASNDYFDSVIALNLKSGAAPLGAQDAGLRRLDGGLRLRLQSGGHLVSVAEQPGLGLRRQLTEPDHRPQRRRPAADVRRGRPEERRLLGVEPEQREDRLEHAHRPRDLARRDRVGQRL
jgi:polyvinyl alcohol dehydrogenase (cytochrome)